MDSLFHVAHIEATWALGVLNTNTLYPTSLPLLIVDLYDPIPLPWSGIYIATILYYFVINIYISYIILQCCHAGRLAKTSIFVWAYWS